MSRSGVGQRFVHSGKVSALAGRELARIYVADNTFDVKVSLLVGRRSQMSVSILYEIGFLAGDGLDACVIETLSVVYALRLHFPFILPASVYISILSFSEPANLHPPEYTLLLWDVFFGTGLRGFCWCGVVGWPRSSRSVRF